MDQITVERALELAKDYYKLDIPFALEGAHGIGKSQGLQKLANDLGIGFVDLRLTVLDETDLIGRPDLVNGKTTYGKPIWLTMIEATGKNEGFLALEEINRADRLVRQPVLQMLWDRRCLQWNIPKGWLPVASWNPSDSNYETFELDPALLSRIIVLKVKSDATSWLQWAGKNEFIPVEIRQFIANFPAKLVSGELTPRHWEIASKIYRVYPKNWDLLEPILGVVTYDLQNFISTLENNLLDPREIWVDWESAKTKLDAIKDRLDLVHLLENSVLRYTISYYNEAHKFSDDFLRGLQQFFHYLQPDAVLAWFQRLKKINPDVTLKLTQGFTKVSRNQTLSLMTHLFGEKIES